MTAMARKPSVLIVDDEDSITATLRLVFEEDGYAVLTAASCSEALHKMENGHKIDAIVTDLNMEREDVGLEVARAAQVLRPRPVIVVCTGYANVGNAREALNIHVDYLVQKPVDLQELKLAMRRLLRRRAEKQLRK